MPIDSRQVTPVVAVVVAGYLAWSGTSPGTVGGGAKNEPLPESGQLVIGSMLPADQKLRDPFDTEAASAPVTDQGNPAAVVEESDPSVVAKLRIRGVLVRGNTRRAVIDNTDVAEGQTYRGLEVVSIALDRIVFRIGDQLVERRVNALFPNPERARVIFNNLRIDGVTEAGGTRRALIDGTLVSEGDKFEGIEVAQIEPDRVVFRIDDELVEKTLASGPAKTNGGVKADDVVKTDGPEKAEGRAKADDAAKGRHGKP